jgi:hypothetical protein
MIYGGVQRDMRASAGNVILVNKYWENRIHSYTWHNERLLSVRFKTDRGTSVLLQFMDLKKYGKSLQKNFITICNEQLMDVMKELYNNRREL